MYRIAEQTAVNINVKNGEVFVGRLAKPCHRLCILLATNTQFKCMTDYLTADVSAIPSKGSSSLRSSMGRLNKTRLLPFASL